MNKQYTEGVKFDGDKSRVELIAPEAMLALGDVLAFGAKKYADRNWELGMSWSRVYGAALRHMFYWASPLHSRYDSETGYSHLHHALCCLMFLVTYEIRGVGTDDMPEELEI